MPDKTSDFNTLQFDEIFNALKKQAKLTDTQPVKVDSAALSTGAATSVNQLAALESLSDIIEQLTDTDTKQDYLITVLEAINAANLNQDQVDATTGSVNTVDYAHHELHSGTRYMVRDYVTLGNGADEDILIITPATTAWAHLTFTFLANDGESIVSFYEAPTVSANGTLANVKNRNRNASDISTTLVYTGPTVTTTGTLLEKTIHGSGKDYGGGARDAEERVLKQNTRYLLRLHNNTVSNNNVNFTLDWYEHTNR